MLIGSTLHIKWDVDDIKERYLMTDFAFSEEKAIAVLRLIDRTHDANIGVSWEVIDIAIDFIEENNT